MAIYHYKNSPLVDHIEIRSPRPGIAQATIVMSDNADATQLGNLRKELDAHKLSSLMDTVDGHAAIQVRGLKDEKALFSALGKLGLSPAGAEKETTPDDHKKKQGFGDRVRGKTLFLSSVFYHLGNIAFFVSGIQRGRHNLDGKFTANDISEILIGATFGLGDVLLTKYGKDKGDEELNAAALGLKRHLHNKGIEIPQGDALTAESLQQSGTFKASDRWLHKHIGQIKCLTEFAGGLATMHSALKPDIRGNINRSKLTAGFLITTGWLSTFLLDKPRGYNVFDGSQPPSSVLLPSQIRDNPRAWIARPLAIGNNLFNLWGAYGPTKGERARNQNDINAAQQELDMHLSMQKLGNSPISRISASNKERLAAKVATAQGYVNYATAKQHDYIWNVFSACSFMVAHVLFGLSGSKPPKDTEDDKSVMNDLVLLSANMLAKQPEKLSGAVIEETADYVSRLSHVTLTKEKVADAIREKVAALSHSSWAARVAVPASGPQVGV